MSLCQVSAVVEVQPKTDNPATRGPVGGQPPRCDGRRDDELRPISFQNGIAPYATGSTLVSWGNTRVICGVTIDETIPRWMKEQGVPGGWITAEYSMLPYSTLDRKPRDISKGRLDGRSQEIQRLIGRAMRAAVELGRLGPRTVWIDCDVLQADGGTRTAAITGSYVALHLAVQKLLADGKLTTNPLADSVAAVSLGVVDQRVLLDLNYEEDSKAEVDMNFVMTGKGQLIEVQGTAEKKPFTKEQFDVMYQYALKGIVEITRQQKATLGPLFPA